MASYNWNTPIDLLSVRNTDTDFLGRKFGPKVRQKILKNDILNSHGRHGPKGKLP